MATFLPTIPRITFTLLEPLSLLSGFLATLVAPNYFVSRQLPHSPSTKAYFIREHESMLVLQLGNAYLLLGLLGVFILNTTTDIKVVRAYLWALWLGDIGHMAFTAWCMGFERLKHIRGWSAVVWGNLGATAFLFAIRSLYFSRVFESDDSDSPVKARAAGKGRGEGIRGRGRPSGRPRGRPRGRRARANVPRTPVKSD